MKLVAVLLSVFFTIVATADDYRDAARRFSITPPPAWVQVSEADVQKYDAAAATVMPDRNFHYFAAFTKNIKKPFDPPYVLVQEINVRLKGGNYDGIEKAMNAVELEKVNKETGAKLSDVIKDFKSDQWVFDRANNRMMMNLSMTDAAGKKLKATCTAYFGEESIIQINCYALESKFAESLLHFNAFNHSFSYDPGSEFQPVSTMSNVKRNALIGAGIGMLVGIITWAKQKFSG